MLPRFISYILGKPYYCEPLRKHISNYDQIQEFVIDREKDIEDKPNQARGLAQYLKKCAWYEDANNINKVYLVKDTKTKQIVAYFALKAGMLASPEGSRLTDEERDLLKTIGIKSIPTSLSGIELSNFAVNDKYREDIKAKTGIMPTKIGKYIFPEFIMPIVEDVSKHIAIQYLYLFAADDGKDETLINYYKNIFDFSTVEDSDNEKISPIQSDYENQCKFMYRKL